jgi:hypothetical protein
VDINCFVKGNSGVSEAILIDVSFLQAFCMEIWTLTCIIECWHIIYNFLMLIENKTTCVQSLKYILKLIPIQVLHALLTVPLHTVIDIFHAADTTFAVTECVQHSYL